VQWGYFGLPLKKISAILYLVGWSGFLKEGIFYIKGTSQALSDALCESLRELEGEIIFGHEAVAIHTKGKKVGGITAVNVKSKAKISMKSPVVISNTDPFVLRDFLPLDLHPAIARYLKKAGNLEPSASAIVAYIGLDCTMEKLTGKKFRATAYIQSETESDKIYELQAKGRLKCFQGMQDYGAIDKTLAPEGKTVINVLRNEFMLDWENLTEDRYKARKEKVKREIIEELEKQFKGIGKHIEVFELGTPRTMKRYTSNYKGAYNGFAFSTERIGMGKGGLSTRTPVKGLYLLSAWSGAFSGGFYGSVINGFVIAQQIF
jgi:all-trans-retinol 13,14-reductase